MCFGIPWCIVKLANYYTSCGRSRRNCFCFSCLLSWEKDSLNFQISTVAALPFTLHKLKLKNENTPNGRKDFLNITKQFLCSHELVFQAKYMAKLQWNHFFAFTGNLPYGKVTWSFFNVLKPPRITWYVSGIFLAIDAWITPYLHYVMALTWPL